MTIEEAAKQLQLTDDIDWAFIHDIWEFSDNEQKRGDGSAKHVDRKMVHSYRVLIRTRGDKGTLADRKGADLSETVKETLAAVGL